jgi:hypothetical protein
MLPSKLLCTIGHFATVSGDGQCLDIFVLCIKFRLQKLQLFCIKCMNKCQTIETLAWKYIQQNCTKLYFVTSVAKIRTCQPTCCKHGKRNKNKNSRSLRISRSTKIVIFSTHAESQSVQAESKAEKNVGYFSNP